MKPADNCSVAGCGISSTELWDPLPEWYLVN